MDLAPFSAIDPCGYPGLRVTQMKDVGFSSDISRTGEELAASVVRAIENA
jgi:lipoyl(octanoyl) transferase